MFEKQVAFIGVRSDKPIGPLDRQVRLVSHGLLDPYATLYATALADPRFARCFLRGFESLSAHCPQEHGRLWRACSFAL